MVLLGGGHSRVEREGNTASPVALGVGEIFGKQMITLAVVGHVVQRFVMNGEANVVGHQTFDEGVPFQAGIWAEDNPEEVPGVVFGSAVDERKVHSGKACESGEVTHCNCLALSAEFVSAFQLGQADCSGEIGQVVLEAGGNDVVFPRRTGGGEAVPDVAIYAVEAHYAGAFGQALVVGDEHAAFAGGDGFVGVEAEAGNVAERTDHAAGVTGGEGVGGVFDDADASGTAESQKARPLG